MFTLKFFKVGNPYDTNPETYEGMYYDIISCDHYSVYEYINGDKCVVTYPSHLSVEGTQREISKTHKDGYSHCFIENINGKTINTVFPDDKKLKDFEKSKQ